MRQLDAGAGYREQIEREIERRIGKAESVGVCAACATKNDADARFCKGCGKALERHA
jgi:predicted amidophosphoribosyltransferase